MKVLLLKSVQKLGKKDDIVEVADGYAENALFRNKLAVPATEARVQNVKNKKEGDLKHKNLMIEHIKKSLEVINGGILLHNAKANEKGSLFSKIDEADIAKILKDRIDATIDPRHIKSVLGIIKHLGVYEIQISIFDEKIHFQLEVKAL